jgi:hypothetical protein
MRHGFTHVVLDNHGRLVYADPRRPGRRRDCGAALGGGLVRRPRSHRSLGAGQRRRLPRPGAGQHLRPEHDARTVLPAKRTAASAVARPSAA